MTMNSGFVFRVTVGQISLVWCVLQGQPLFHISAYRRMAQNPTDRGTFPSSQQQSRFL